jgi:hypothetical protein
MTEQSGGCVDSSLGPQEEAPSIAHLAWDALNASLQETATPCDGRALFTADRLSDEQRALCASICTTCPIAVLCDAYASAAKVPSGFWAGHSYSPKGKK